MLQSVATLISLFLATGMMAVIAAVLADDWLAVTRALAGRTSTVDMATVRASRSSGCRRARVLRVRSQSAPLRAAA
jgi:hypothetical protein